MQTTQNQTIKFTQGFDPAFLGAEGWADGEKPFYFWGNKFVCIVDASGVFVYKDPESNQFQTNGKQFATIEEAKTAIAFFETLSEAKFLEMVEALFERDEF